jgi:hypothetical protein
MKDDTRSIPTDPEAGLTDAQAAELLGLSVHTLRAYRQEGPPYQGPKFTKYGRRITYVRKDVLEHRERYGIPAVMADEAS